MKIKIIERAWYGNKLYDPDIEGETVIEYTGDKCPSWAVEVGNEKPANKTANKPAGEGEGNKGGGNKTKVKDLPLVEKNALLEAAKAVGIEGNQVLSWNVETLKAKIEAAKPAGEGEGNKGEGEE